MPEPARQIEIWSIFDRPKDYPDGFIARKSIATMQGSTPTNEVITSEDLESIRDRLENMGLAKIARSPEDPAYLLESWF